MPLYKNRFGPAQPDAMLALTEGPKNLRTPIAIGGPCSIESEDQLDTIFDTIGDTVTHMRGGVFRQGTYPGSKALGWERRGLERGSVSFMDHVRWDLSISLIAKLKQLTNVPTIVDASHGTGDRSIVKAMTLAGIAAGADGFLVETHYDPDGSLSDAEQAVSLEAFLDIAAAAETVRGAL